MRAPRWIHPDQLQQHAHRGGLLSHPLHIPLPTLPAAHGQRDSFRTSLRTQLQQWKDQWPVLTPLLVPIKATLLVVAPPNGKDLDNLVRGGGRSAVDQA